MTRISPLVILLGTVLLPSAFSSANDQTSSLSAEDVLAPSAAEKPATWSFEDCLKWATDNSTDVRRNILSILQADESIGEAKDAWLPDVGFTTGQNFSNHPSPSDGINANAYNSSYAVNASWTIWDGNIRKYRLESARLLKKQTVLDGDNIRKNIILGVLQAYLNIMYSAEAVTIASQTLEVSTAQAERAHKLMLSGRTSKVEYAQIESQRAQDEYNLVQAQSSYSSSVLSLKTILQLDLGYDLRIADVSFPDSEVLSTLPSMADTYAFAASWLPELKSNELNKEIYDNDIRIAKAGRLPNISLSGSVATGYSTGKGAPSWTYQMGHGVNEAVGISLSVPIYDGNATRRAVAQAKLASLQYDLDKEELLNNLSQTIESIYLDANNARAGYRSATARLESATLTADLVDRQFELGLVNPLDLLQAHNDLLNARLELLQAKFMAILANKTINYYATTAVEMPTPSPADTPVIPALANSED